jgi:tetratricopeptide (TPR) repeat protein
VSGYLSRIMVINDSVLNIAFDWVDQGIKRFPDRLDLRMGKVYLAIETDRMEEVYAELQSAILSGDSIHHEWKWMREEMLDSGQYFLYSSVQGHLYKLFEKQDNVADEIILGISELMLAQDDQQYFAMTNAATVFMIKKQFNMAIDWLKKADKIHEKDPIILSNLGYCYGELQEWKRARRYYEEALKWSEDDNGREYCQRQLDRLREEERK